MALKVSVIVPCRNEAFFIESFVRNVFCQKVNELDLELIVADGMSDDGTRDVLHRLAGEYINLKVIDNEGLIVSSALNLCLSIANGDVIVRMDVHTKYNLDYIQKCVQVLELTGATCVGGAWRSTGNTLIQKAISDAFQSSIGSGGAASRKIAYSGWVDTVYLGAWWRDDLVNLGGFDEFFVRNQDDELALRTIKAGGRIWQSADIISFYTPRSSFGNLFGQFMQYGYWKIPVILKHNIPASPRHVIPFLFFSVVLFLLILSIIYPACRLLFIIAMASYITFLSSCVINFSFKINLSILKLLTVVALIIMHFGYAIGFARGLMDFVILRRVNSKKMISLTR